jgi:hypothetical protein
VPWCCAEDLEVALHCLSVGAGRWGRNLGGARGPRGHRWRPRCEVPVDVQGPPSPFPSHGEQSNEMAGATQCVRQDLLKQVRQCPLSEHGQALWVAAGAIHPPALCTALASRSPAQASDLFAPIPLWGHSCESSTTLRLLLVPASSPAQSTLRCAGLATLRACIIPVPPVSASFVRLETKHGADGSLSSRRVMVGPQGPLCSPATGRFRGAVPPQTWTQIWTRTPIAPTRPRTRREEAEEKG